MKKKIAIVSVFFFFFFSIPPPPFFINKLFIIQDQVNNNKKIIIISIFKKKKCIWKKRCLPKTSSNALNSQCQTSLNSISNFEIVSEYQSDHRLTIEEALVSNLKLAVIAVFLRLLNNRDILSKMLTEVSVSATEFTGSAGSNDCTYMIGCII